MEDVNISIYRASVVREGSTPASPGFVVSEGQNPVDPSGSGQNHLPVTITTAATGLSITESQVLGGAGTVGQYIRGDGSLADFPESSGGGSSISYYLNGSVSQGTIGGVAYKELNKVPILGAGTDFTINANGYIASFLTDAGDPNLLEIPGGNWNFETFFSANNGGGSPTFYVELYKYNGTTFTLIASNSTFPELIAFGTNVTAYFSTLAVPTTTLALTDRLAIRYYVTHSGRTITLHTENGHLCQIITTFTTGLTALNGLTAQVQNFAVGTSGTDFAIASATATHTFNLPTASATNRGALSSADWTTFNNKTSNLGTVTSVGLSSATSGVTIGSSPVTTSGTITLAIATASGSQNGLLSSTDWTTFNGKENAITAGTTLQYFRGDKTFQTLNTAAVPELTNLYYTEARVNANTNVAANTAARHNAVTLGTPNGLSLSTQVLSLTLASAGVTGALSGTDWTTFNSKQNALTNPVTGTGTTNYVPKFTGSTTIGNSRIFDNGTNIGINTIAPNDFIDGESGMAILQSTNGRAVLSLVGTRTDANEALGRISFTNSNSTNIGAKRLSYISGVRGSTNNSAFLEFAVANDALGGPQMILSQLGNLLVGASNQSSDNGARLQVSGTATVSGNVTIGQASAATNVKLIFNGVLSKAAGIEFQQSGTPQWYIGNGIASEDNNFELYNSNGTMAMKIIKSTNAINFIGAATFSSSVTVQNGNTLILLQPGNGNGSAIRSVLNGDFRVTTGGTTDALTITNGGNVLIGTATSGASKLRIVGLPTSSSGLSSGDVWNNGGTLRIV